MTILDKPPISELSWHQTILSKNSDGDSKKCCHKNWHVENRQNRQTNKPTVNKIFLSGQFRSNPFGGIHKGSPRSGGRGSARSGPNVIRWPTQPTLPPKPPFLPPEKNLNISGTSGQIGLKFEKNDFQKFELPPLWLDQSSRIKSISTSDSQADKTGNADIWVPRESGRQAATMSMETSLA